jgi:hypothetical protein
VDEEHLALDIGALAENDLGLRLVVPEARGQGLFVQIVERFGELSEVKDTSSAHRIAASDLQAFRALRPT